jgi:hypothetical protein
MAFTPTDIDTGVAVLWDLGARTVWLFGSALEDPSTARDLDFACEGLPPERFYLAVGKLLDGIRKPVDLVDVGENTRRNRYIRAKGRILYDAR